MSSLQLTSLQLHNLSAPASVHSSASTPMRIQHDPYKHSCFFGSSIKSDASSQDDEWIPTPPQMSQRNTAPSTPYHRPAAGAVTSIPEHTSAAPTELMHEGALSGRCELLVTPLGVQDIEQPTPMGKPSLFLGHMRFETTAAELRWLIFTTTGVRVLKCEPRAAGCFVVHLDNENDVSLVRSLHKRLLFDLGGVWFARTKEQVAIMADYIQEKLAPKRSRREKVRVPHDALCVETQKTQARRPQPAPLMHHGNVPLPPFYYGQQQAFSAVPPAYYDAAGYGAPCMGYGY